MNISHPRIWELIRHSESEAQYHRRLGKSYTGDENPPLSAHGREQARIAGESRLGTRPPEVIISSGLDRARETAEIFSRSAGWNMNVIQEPAFNEQSYGEMAHLSEDEQKELFPEEYWKKFQKGFWFFRPPGGESWQDVHARVVPAFERVSREYSGKHVVLFGHASGNQILRMLIEGWNVEQLLSVDLRLSDNCATTTYVLMESNGDSADMMYPMRVYFRPHRLMALDQEPI